MEKQKDNTVTLPKTPETAAAILATRYTSDASFRAEFDQDPKAALAKSGGREIPSDVEIVVHRNGGQCWHIVLPSEEQIAALDDRDIGAVSGGTMIQLQSWHTMGSVYGEAWCRERDIDPNWPF